jgi:pimeloyl-ACP methyl ester carboxylesterase
LLRALLLGMDAPGALVAETRSAIRRVAPEVMAARLRAVLEADVRKDLERADVPVTYLRASRDRLVGRWAPEQVRAARPEATVVTFDAPHLLLQRRPREGAAALLEIASTPSSRSSMGDP